MAEANVSASDAEQHSPHCMDLLGGECTCSLPLRIQRTQKVAQSCSTCWPRACGESPLRPFCKRREETNRG